MPVTYNKIASVTVGSGGSSNIQFTSIPSNYTDLVVLTSFRSDRAAHVDIAGVRFNGSTALNYSSRRLDGNSTQASSNTVATADYTFGWFAYATAASTGANSFASSAIYVPNYRSSSNKSYSTDFAVENNSSTANQAFVGILAGLWADTSAITSIDIIPGFGTNFVQYSTATLYGISKS